MITEIKVLGAGCAKCKATLALIGQVLEQDSTPAKVLKVEDMAEIMSHGIMSTPGILVNGEMKMVGKVPSHAQVRDWLVHGTGSKND